MTTNKSNKQVSNGEKDVTIMVIIMIFIVLGFLAFDFFIGIAATIGWFKLILIPVMWELLKTGFEVIVSLIKSTKEIINEKNCY